MMKKIITNNVDETTKLAESIANHIPDEITTILLDGTLGSGKTTFVKGFGKAINVSKNINSPTFTIMKVYEGDKTLYHFDFYRLEHLGGDFDLSDYIEDDRAISLIEWPFNVREVLPEKYLLIKLIVLDENQRQIEITSVGYPTEWIDKL